MPKTKNPKTERIRQRLEEIKAAAKPAAVEEEVELTASDIQVPLTESDNKEEFTLDGASKFTMQVDGQRLVGQYRLGDSTIVINDPVGGYISSVPTTLALAINVTGVGKLVELEKPDISIPRSFKLRSGELFVSMAVPISLPRVAWREVNKKIVWSIIQYQPLKNEWRITRLKSTPRQSIYEASEILRGIMGDTVFSRLKEAIELLAEPL